jgi:beta-xylosidase
LFPRETKPRNRRDFLNRQISSVARRVRDRRIRKKIFEYQLSRGYPIDQTAKSDALAQIEIVCQKI